MMEEQEQQDPGPSLYNFDLMSSDGVDRLVALLPILDEAIVKSVYQECFPGYPIDNISPRMARVELRGFFMDFLDGEASANTNDLEGTPEDAGPEADAPADPEEGGDGAFDPAAEGSGDPEPATSPEGEGEDQQAEAPPDGDDV